MSSSCFVRLSVAVLIGVACGSPSARAQRGAPIVSNTTAGQLGLERTWATQLRVDASRGRVGGVEIRHGMLLAFTTRGSLQAVDAETGRTVWTAGVGDPDYVTQAPSMNETFVAVTNGSTLYVLDRAGGAVVWQQRVGGSPCAGTAISDQYAFVPLDNGIVEAYKLRRESRVDEIPQRYSGTGGAVTAPIVIGDRVLWTTGRGYVYSRQVGQDLVQFRYHMDDDGSAAPAYMSPYVYCASRNGTVYCLQEATGMEVWRFSAGNSISHPLLTIDGALFCVTEKGEMLRLDPRSGAQIWYQRGVGRVVAADKGRLYVFDLYGRLAVLDAATGSQLGALALGDFDLPILNVETDRLYLATATGLLESLRGVAQSRPLVHSRGYAVPPPKKPGAPGEAAPADASTPAETPAAAAPAAPGNPFGGKP